MLRNLCKSKREKQRAYLILNERLSFFQCIHHCSNFKHSAWRKTIATLSDRTFLRAKRPYTRKHDRFESLNHAVLSLPTIIEENLSFDQKEVELASEIEKRKKQKEKNRTFMSN